MTVNAHKLFLVDTLGAGITTAMMLLFAQYPELIGLPKLILYIFSIIGLGCFVYSILNYKLLTRNWGFNLKGIAIVNTLYALSVIGIIYYHFDSITLIGLIYFSAESFILFLLSWLEYKVGDWST